jgi:hypothetical protein
MIFVVYDFFDIQSGAMAKYWHIFAFESTNELGFLFNCNQ